MSFIHDTRSVEQQSFFSGQRLFDTDLQGIEAFNREMRWLHNQSLHQPGIGNGFAVSGKKGDRSVRIDPGYAIDDLGREIVLTSSRTIPAPPVAGDGGKPRRYLLSVAYPDDVDLEVVEWRAGLCDEEGATRLRVEPIFCWVPLHDNGNPESDEQGRLIQNGHQLVLAEIAVRDCKLVKDLSITQRRNARPSQQPYIACGESQPTSWQIWQLPDAANGDLEERPDNRICGLEAFIDTSGAGFLTEPNYFARLHGDRLLPFSTPDGEVMVVLDGLVHIVEPMSEGFTARVLVLPFAILNAGDSEVVELRTSTDSSSFCTTLIDEFMSKWSIIWMGVEG